jgi:hypothetical protein
MIKPKLNRGDQYLIQRPAILFAAGKVKKIGDFPSA